MRYSPQNSTQKETSKGEKLLVERTLRNDIVLVVKKAVEGLDKGDERDRSQTIGD